MSQIIKSIPVSWYEVDAMKHSDTYNNKNLHSYDPYILNEEGELVIDQKWWNSLTDYIKKLIITRSKVVLEDNLKIPHRLYKGHLLTIVYRSYLDGFDYNIWYNPQIENLLNPEVKIISLDKWKNDLTKITKSNLDGDLQSIKASTAPELKELQIAINDSLKLFPNTTEFFVRLSGTSGKNEVALEPLYSAEEILDHITRNQLFLNQEYLRTEKTTHLIIMPWSNDFDERYEFRIFVVNGRLTGISQQKWFFLFQYSEEEIEMIIRAMNNLKFLDKVPYITFVGDVYINPSDEECYLIECNPFGEHCGAGSALFNWETDNDQLNGRVDGDVPFRHLSLIL